MGFYEVYVALMGNLRDKPDRATPYKIEYLKTIIGDGKVYKFISFEGNRELTENKITTLKQGKIWFSFYKTLNDNTEFQICYDAKKIASRTGRSVKNIDLLINCFTEMYDVYSLTYAYQDYMWKDYASNGNGICIEYEVGNYDYLYPVQYQKKSEMDFNEMIISGINNGDFTFAIMPWVIKNPYNETANMDSTKEKEVRILYCPYDLGEINAGRLEKNIKEKLGYKGIAKPYADFGLRISKVIFGNKCDNIIRSELETYFRSRKINYIYL